MERCGVAFLLCALFAQSAVLVDAEYGTVNGPITCLCADGVSLVLDSTPLVRRYGCSLFDFCERCTHNPYQPCEECPPNRYGRMCEKECNCGLESCDHGVDGDGECHCATEEFNEGHRCQYIKKSVAEQAYEPLPAPDVRVMPSDILLSWQQYLHPEDPVVEYRVEYIVSRNQNPYSQWTLHTVVAQSNKTIVSYPYSLQENAFYKFRIRAVHQRGDEVTGQTTDIIKIPGTPSQPGNVRVKSVQGNSLTIAWDAPQEDAAFGSEVLGYVFQVRLSRRSDWTTLADAGFDENKITVSDLEFSRIYRFRVAARNKLGVGLWSNEESILVKDNLHCFNRDDASDYRGTETQTVDGYTCKKWTDVAANTESEGAPIYTPETAPGMGLGNHNFCRNPSGARSTAWCYATLSYWPRDCDVGRESEDPCPQKCATGLMQPSTGGRECVADDETEVYSKVPLTNGEICTCALQVKSTGEYLRPSSYLGWTYACAHAMSQKATYLVENIYSMDADVCYEECTKRSGCDAFTYSTNGYNETKYSDEESLRLCTLFSDLNRPVEITKSDAWTGDLSQDIPDDKYILSWGCWAATDPRNPSDVWEDVNMQSFLVFKDFAFKNYSIDVTVSSAPSSGLYISLIVIGTVNVTTPINIEVSNGDTSVTVSNINVGFISALKVTGQIGEDITIEQIVIRMDTVTVAFDGDWCGDGDYSRRPERCRNRGRIGGSATNTRLLKPSLITLFTDFHGFACSSMAYTGSSSESFFGWCPLTPKLLSVGLPEIWPSHFVGLLDKEDAARQRRAAAEEAAMTYTIYEAEKTWQEAVDTCLANGQVLVNILSNAGLSEVERAIRDAGSRSDFWVNGYNSGGLTWKTHDGQPLNLNAFESSPWTEGEPNLSGKCLQLWYRSDSNTYKFDDNICSNKKRFICQSLFSLKTSECKYNNEKYANTECVAMLDFNIEDMRNEYLEDKSVIVEEAALSMNFREERHIRYLAIEGISEPWTRTTAWNANIPPSVLIDVVDTNTTKELALDIYSENLRGWTEERLNGHAIAGRYGIMVRPLTDYQQAGFDDIVDWSGSSLRPRMKVKIHLYKWLVGPWTECEQNQECLGGLQKRKVSCIDAVTNAQADEKNCRFHQRPHSEQSCQTSFDPRCYRWKYVSRPKATCKGTGKCGFGTLPGHVICQDIVTLESVPEYYCGRKEKPDVDRLPTFGCSDFTGCTYEWVLSSWSECSDMCGAGHVSRYADCFCSNGTKVADSMCASLPRPSTEEKCQNYSDCDVWESLQLLRQDQIYSDRSRIQKQINLSVSTEQAEMALMDAKQSIAEKELEYTLQTIRFNMSIPEELAKAERLEAQARQAVAKHTIQIPHEGSLSFPNVGYLGRGYDIFYGNPMNDDGSVDPGFRQSVIGLTYEKVRYSSDRKFLVPDQADIIREMGSYFGSSTSIVTSERSYRESLSTEVSVGGSYSGLFASGSFSASASYAKMKQSTMNTQSVFVDIIGRVLVYDARLVPFNMDASEEFREAVGKLPAVRCCAFSITCHPGCTLYDDFIEAFGTHYTTSVLMGGRAVQRYQMTSSSMEEHQSQDVGAGFSASGGVGGVASFSASASFKMSNSMSTSLSQSSASSKEFFLGGEAGVGEISEGSTDSIKEWSSTVFDNPVPVRYKLTAVLDLLTKANFPEDAKIEDKYEVLQSRYLSYCNRLPNARCGDFSSPDDVSDEKQVRFGDVVHITLDSEEGTQYVLQERSSSIYAYTDNNRGYRYWWQKATITPLVGKVCTWVQKTSRGPINRHGKDWVKFMIETDNRICSRSITYKGISKDECEERCKERSICNAGSYTAEVSNGFCILFTSPEHTEYRSYLSGKPEDNTYLWSCYHVHDTERFGGVWSHLRIHSFRARYKIGEQRKMFSLLSPLSINNVKKEPLAYGDPLILASSNGVVSRSNIHGYEVVSGDLYDKDHLRFQLVNDYKPNGMPVKYGDDIMLAELPISDRSKGPTSKLLMQPLPYYLSVPGEDSRTYRSFWCYGWWWWCWWKCIDRSNVHVKPKTYDTETGSVFTWTINKADVRGLIPQPSRPPLSGLERVDFQALEDGKSLSVTVTFTRPVRRKYPVPDTVEDESPTVGSLPGYDARDLLSSDFRIKLTRGLAKVYSPIKQYFVFGGRQLTEYQLKVLFQHKMQDGDVIRLDLSHQIVSVDEDELGGESFVEQHIYLQPTFTVEVVDASSLLTNDAEGVNRGNFTLRVNFNKPVVNAERELPKPYDFELHDANNRTFFNMIKSVDQVRTGCSIGKVQPCPTDFNVVVSSSFLRGERKFTFDVSSGRLKSRSDFLFVNQRSTLVDLEEVAEEP